MPDPDDCRLRLPMALIPFMDGRGALSAWEADQVRAVLRRCFAPPIPPDLPPPEAARSPRF